MNQERFRFFESTYQESDLLIGVSHNHFSEEMIEISIKELVRLRDLVDNFTVKHPNFGTSLEPILLAEVEGGSTHEHLIPDEIFSMIDCGIRSETGPMSAVAGLFAERVGNRLVRDFGPEEVVVENGGDLFLHVESDVVSAIHASSSPLSDKMGFIIPPGTWGVCTSSGTIGHSYSRGNADAVTIISKSTPLADAWATSLANQIKTEEDIEVILEQVSQIPEILGCAVILGERIGILGEIEVKPLS